MDLGRYIGRRPRNCKHFCLGMAQEPSVSARCGEPRQDRADIDIFWHGWTARGYQAISTNAPSTVPFAARTNATHSRRAPGRCLDIGSDVSICEKPIKRQSHDRIHGEKIALFIDGANLYATAKSLGFDIDYKQLAARIPVARLPAARLLLHRAGRGSGIFLDPPADRLARLQRLHGRHQADQGIRRLRPAAARSRATWTSSSPSMRWRWPSTIDHIVLFSGDGDFRSLVEAVQRQGRQGHRRLDPLDAAADDRRRTAPPGRPSSSTSSRCRARSAAIRPSARRAPTTARRSRRPAPGIPAAPSTQRRAQARRRCRRRGRRRDSTISRDDAASRRQARTRLPALPAPGRLPRGMARRQSRPGSTRRCRPSGRSTRGC